MRTITIPPFGPIEEKDGDITLDFLQEQVGGYIEGLSLRGCYCYLNEEGKLNGLPINPRADAVVRRMGAGISPWDVIVGPVIFVGAGDADGNDTGLSNKAAGIIKSIAVLV